MGLFSSIAGFFGAKKVAKAYPKAAQAQIEKLQAAIDQFGALNNASQGRIAGSISELSPNIDAGHAALGHILDLLGLGGHGATPGTDALVTPGKPDFAAYVQNNPDLLADYQVNGAGKSLEQYGQEHWAQFGQHEGRAFTPTTGGTVTTPGTPGEAALSADGAQQQSIDALQNSPLFQSLMRNGTNSILSNASATGGLRGGNVQHSLADFSVDTLAKVIQQQLSNLGGIAGQGLEATGSGIQGQLDAGRLNLTTAGGIANLLGAQGDAKAGGILGKAGAKAQALGSLGGIGDQIASMVAGGMGGGFGGGLGSTLATLGGTDWAAMAKNTGINGGQTGFNL